MRIRQLVLALLVLGAVVVTTQPAQTADAYSWQSTVSYLDEAGNEVGGRATPCWGASSTWGTVTSRKVVSREMCEPIREQATIAVFQWSRCGAVAHAHFESDGTLISVEWSTSCVPWGP